MTFKKGEITNPNGRPKGAKGKFTTLKEAFIEAFEEMGGKDFLVEYAKGDKISKGRFLQMVANMLPKDVQISGPNGSDHRIIVVIPPASASQEKAISESNPQALSG